MARPTTLGELSDAQWDQLQELADRFESAWEGAEENALEDYLPDENDDIYIVALYEFIKSDLEVRWRRGRSKELEEYIAQFPQLGTPQEIAAQLIYEEYRIRQLYGDQPSLESFQVRFPAQYSELDALLHQQPLPAQQPASPASGPSNTQTNSTLSVGGGYRILEQIGAGGFGEVWRAEAPGGIEVAIKIISRPIDQGEAKREFDALNLIKRLRHPFLIQTQAFWSFEDRLYIVMDLAEGSLRHRLKECRTQGLSGIPIDELVTYFCESAEALDYLHSEQVHHRDIKPDNILLLKRHARVADFGLARVLERRMVTATGSGTPAYMPPELWQGKVSSQSDQYSLAMTYAELRLNRRLFASKIPAQVMMDHLQTKPDLSPLAGPEQDILHKALAKNPDERFEDCSSFTAALAESLADELSGSMLRVALSGRAIAGSASSSSSSGSPASATIPRGSATTADQVDTANSQETLPVGRPSWRDPPSGTKRSPIPAMMLGLVGLAILVPLIWLIARRTGDAVLEIALPEGFTAFAQDEASIIKDRTGKQFHQLIGKEIAGVSVEFVAVPQMDASHPPSFYIMKDKVWNSLYAAFADSAEGKSLLEGQPSPFSNALRNEWQSGGIAGGKDLGISNPRLPVMRVTVLEAHCCAQWLGGLLPTARQWDTAAGRFNPGGREGPYMMEYKGVEGEIAVNRGMVGPLEVGGATMDISPYGCHDMSGNGREWTRSFLIDSSRFVPASDARPDDLIELRGRSYFRPEPLRFADITAQREAERYELAMPDIGFRVVVEP